MNREQILSKAEKLINGQRATDYGDAYENHARIAEGWNVIMRGALSNSGYLTPAHVALMRSAGARTRPRRVRGTCARRSRDPRASTGRTG